MQQVLVSRETEDTFFSPADQQFTAWVKHALQPPHQNSTIYICLVSAEEIQSLNRQYRNKDKPTNILSFPFDVPPGVPYDHLGDLIICPSIVCAEAKAEHKSLEAHWAHLTIHGTLHLQGYDHEKPEEAIVMENFEVQLLAQIGYSNPYRSS